FQSVREFVWVNIFGSWACCNYADFWIVFGVIYAVIDILFINEWAVFPLTKSAKAAAKARELAAKQEQEEQEQNVPTDQPAETVETVETAEPEPEEKTDDGSGEE
ncbi:MAG: hypothetical protein K2N17_03510, partial [Clostridia bacterium]|nr:hypothetical protein [Clostridia bacterium]